MVSYIQRLEVVVTTSVARRKTSRIAHRSPSVREKVYKEQRTPVEFLLDASFRSAGGSWRWEHESSSYDIGTPETYDDAFSTMDIGKERQRVANQFTIAFVTDARRGCPCRGWGVIMEEC